MNLLPELGFGDLTENEDFFRNVLARYVLEKGDIFCGYYGMYAWARLGDIELNLHLEPMEDGMTVVGFTSHVSGNQFWRLAVSSAVPGDGDEDALERWVHFVNPEGKEAGADIYLVNEDVVPDYYPGDILDVQVVAIAWEVAYYADEEAYYASERAQLGKIMGKPIGFKMDNVFSIMTESIALGTIQRVDRLTSFDEKGKPRGFYRISIDTDLGRLEIMHGLDSVKEEEQEFMRPGCVIYAKCNLLGDVAIEKYQQGAIFDEEHIARLFRNCCEAQDFTRLQNIVASLSRYVTSSGRTAAKGKKKVLDYLNDIAARQRKNGRDYPAFPATVVGIDENVAGEGFVPEFPIGTHCVAMAQNEEGKIDTVIFLLLDEENHIREIRSAGEREEMYQISIQAQKEQPDLGDFQPIQLSHTEREWLEVIKDCYEKKSFEEMSFYYGLQPGCALVQERDGVYDFLRGRETIYEYYDKLMKEEPAIKCRLTGGRPWGHAYGLRVDMEGFLFVIILDVDAEGKLVKITEHYLK